MSVTGNFLTKSTTGIMAAKKLDDLVEQLAYARNQKAIRDGLEKAENERHNAEMRRIADTYTEGNYYYITDLSKDIKSASENLASLLAHRLGG